VTTETVQNNQPTDRLQPRLYDSLNGHDFKQYISSVYVTLPCSSGYRRARTAILCGSGQKVRAGAGASWFHCDVRSALVSRFRNAIL